MIIVHLLCARLAGHQLAATPKKKLIYKLYLEDESIFLRRNEHDFLSIVALVVSLTKLQRIMSKCALAHK